MPSGSVLFHALAFLMAALWGLNYSILQSAVAEGGFHPLALVFFATSAAFPVYFVAAVIQNKGFSFLKGWKSQISLAFWMLGAGQLFVTLGVQRSTPAHAAMLVGLTPIFVLLENHRRHRSGILSRQVAGFFLALAGIGFLMWPGFHQGGLGYAGELLCLLAAFSFAMYLLKGKENLSKQSPEATLALIFGLGWFMQIPIALYPTLKQDWSSLTPSHWLCAFYFCFAATMTCYWIQFRVLQKFSAGTVSGYSYLQPFFATVFSLVLGREVFSFHLAAGGLCILFGLLIAEGFCLPRTPLK